MTLVVKAVIGSGAINTGVGPPMVVTLSSVVDFTSVEERRAVTRSKGGQNSKAPGI